MRVIISFMILMFVKIFAYIFYKLEVKWISKIKGDFKEVRLVILLHHTSLYEPLYMMCAPNWFIWRMARKMVAPVADKTLNRPLVGKFWKFMAPGLMSVTRKRDKSWFEFLEAIKNRSVIVIAPEGRMKRGTGLDSEGKTMTVRSGVAEIINELDEGRILIAYSGGLHHVQHPGELMPRLFKKLKLNLECLPVSEYKAQFNSDGIQFRRDIVTDLEHRLKNNCPDVDS
jgi:hypothetical protein